MIEESKNQVAVQITDKEGEDLRKIVFDAVERNHGHDLPGDWKSYTKVVSMEVYENILEAELYIPDEDCMFEVICNDIQLNNL